MLCRKADTGQCLFCEGALGAQCVAWGDYTDEAAEILVAIDAPPRSA